MRRWIWVRFGGEDAVELKARTYEEAMRKAIAWRLANGSEDAEDAQRWFHENDEIYELTEKIEIKPYEGEIKEML